MKKKIITISIIIIAAVGLLIGLNYFLSLRDITFKLSTDVSEITIYKKANFENKKNPIKISSNQTIRLQTGDYIIVPSGEKIASNQINLTITKNAEVEINPNYSANYLNSLYAEAKTSIYQILVAKYPDIINNYSLQTGQLFIKGEWFGGLLVNIKSDRDSIKDCFKFIAHKENNVWQIVNYPDLILSQNVYKTVPAEIINTVNNFIAEN